MGKVVEEKKKKKKGRPSLLDLQKRSLKEQQQQQQKPNPNSHTNQSQITPSPNRRSTRRNPNLDVVSQETEDNTDATGEDDDELNGKRREKKLKLVLKLPSQRSPLNSASLNSGSYGADYNPKDDSVGTNHNKPKFYAIADGSSAHGNTNKAEKHVSAPSSKNFLQGTLLEMGPRTPLPDKNLLLFILDRLQKKDTYGVFAEPVNPKELPDYHEVVEHPMDFGTVRKNLVSGAYANLEQFEKDVFLICSNAMQYNSPDTIYFRQARSILELAKKNFENIRQDSDDYEPEQKIVRRGRPPTKNLKKPLGRPSLERGGSEFSSDGNLATGAEHTTWSNYDLRKGPPSDKSGLADFSGQFLHGSRNSEAYSGWLPEQKTDRNDEFTGSMLKGNWMKHGKKQVVFDESRRNTYKQSHLSSGAREPSVLTTFNAERKQLTAVGVHTEYGNARSLARFAANLGPVTWKVVSKKIEKSLPAGVKFGPGWVGENDGVPLNSLVFPSPPTCQPSSPQPFSLPRNSYGAATPSNMEIKVEKSSDNPEGHNLSEKHMASTHSVLDGQLGKPLVSSGPTSGPVVGNRFPEPTTESASDVRGTNFCPNINMTSSSVGIIRPGSPFQTHQNPVIHPGMNGFNGSYGLNLPAQIGKLIGSVGPTGINQHSSRIVDPLSRDNTNFVHPVPANCLSSEELLENTNTISGGSSLPASGREGFMARRTGLQPQPHRQQLPLQQKPDPVPPDLNVIFQSPGSPTSSKVDSTQPDLALQL